MTEEQTHVTNAHPCSPSGIISGKPVINLLLNPPGYRQMTVFKNIGLNSSCVCHRLPVTLTGHVAYFSSHRPKDPLALRRVLQYCCQDPQVQEYLTVRLAGIVREVFATNEVAVLLEAVYQCRSEGGLFDKNSSLITVDYSGKFVNTETKNEFLRYAGY